ncbi:ATP-binding cassette domain-containing protein [Nocardiopsis akebiae]|uniref:hypothetical protein n=1 Tax=Nocardiopsis akebiae TaxID=2831968 RepID=UPI0023DE7A01|nr:hypothetical protein [Nocardiopsis akebiae]
MERLGIADKRGTQYRRPSGWQKQRVSIAPALVGRPSVTVLDELTTGLDPQARRDTWELIEDVRDSGAAVVHVTHFMDEAERPRDRLALIDSGRVAALDTPDGLVTRASPEQRVTFRAPPEFGVRLLTARPEVVSAHRRGRQVRAAGRGDLLHAVTSVLAPTAVRHLTGRVRRPAGRSLSDRGLQVLGLVADGASNRAAAAAEAYRRGLLG